MDFAEKYKTLDMLNLKDELGNVIERINISPEAYAVGEMLEMILGELKKANNKNK